jgi:hypothetical protein
MAGALEIIATGAYGGFLTARHKSNPPLSAHGRILNVVVAFEVMIGLQLQPAGLLGKAGIEKV